MAWLLSGGYRDGHGGLWGPGDSKGSVPPSPALPSPEGSGDREGREWWQGRGGSRPGQGWNPFPKGVRVPVAAPGSGSVPSGTALPARKWAGKRRDPAGTVRSQLALLRCPGSPAESPGMRWLWVVALVAPACTVPYNGTAGSTGHGDNGDRGPCTPQHGTLGTEVLLPCPGDAAEWRRGDTVLGTSPAPGLALPNASLAHEGHYSCHHPVTGETWATICLRLGYPPPPPAIQCWATSYPQAVNCSWGLSPEPLLDTDFVATYRHGADTGECTLTGPRSCSFGDLQVFSLSPYELNVTARNALGAASGSLPFLLENIIKPDPPEALRVSPIPGEPQKLLLEWSPPSSWPFPEYFPLQYRIRYSRDNDSVLTTVGPYELTSHTLTDLEPGSLHHIQVAAKDGTDAGEFSAWSPPASGTPWLGL